MAILYVAQGFPAGVFRKVWPVYFRDHGVSLTEIGLISLLGLPYTLKPLWAPLVDRYGDRRHWIAACLVVMAILLAIHPLFDPSNAGIGLWAVLLFFTIASATQDIAIDAHTIGFLEKGEEGAANGIRVAMWRAAYIVSGGLLLALAGATGWPPTFLIGGARPSFCARRARSSSPPSASGSSGRSSSGSRSPAPFRRSLSSFSTSSVTRRSARCSRRSGATGDSPSLRSA